MLIRDSYTKSDHACECDWCGKKEPFTKGYAHVAMGATGRHCIVMSACDKCGDLSDVANGRGVPTADEAREIIAARNDPRQWADF
jgi:hypothetical protein